MKNNISVENATLTFTVPEEVKHQSDLLVAEAQMGVNRVAEGTNNEPVSLKFKHLLSRIGFEIVATGIPTDNVNVVELVEVSLNGGFASSGTVDMTKDNKTTGEGTAAVTNTLAIVTAPTAIYAGWEVPHYRARCIGVVDIDKNMVALRLSNHQITPMEE